MDLKNIINVIKNISKEDLSQVKTLIIVCMGLLLFSVSIDDFLEKFLNLRVRSVFYSSILLIWLFYWLFNKLYLPRNKKDKVGIVIAIYSENEYERYNLKADFISKIKKNLHQDGLSNSLQVIFLKNHFSSQIKDSDDQKGKLEAINKKIKAHLYIYGDIKKRFDGDEGEKYFINFQGYVTNRLIPQNLIQKISIDFSKVLPSEVSFLKKRSFKGFEASAARVHLAAKYIIGVAAFLSQNPQLAFDLHKNLKCQFNELRPLPPDLQDIRKSLSYFISDEALWIARLNFEDNNINQVKQFLNKAIFENNNSYGAWLFKAIVDFKVDKNINESVKSIKKAERYSANNYEWMYSKAFLFFWKEDYSSSLKICQKIKKQKQPIRMLFLKEIIDFNLDLLEKNKNKAQLYFWIGYLSYFKGDNLVDALSYFESFEKFATDDMKSLKQKSVAYLREIKQKININE